MGEARQGVTPSSDFDEEVGPTRQRDALVGQQLGEYLIEARLGEGAMGIVYRGVQPMIGRAVAVKVLKPGFDDSGELLQEARAVSAARHPNIIDIFSFGTTPNGQQYFVMELLAGEALDLWLRSRTLTTLEAVGILKQLLSGLAAAHSANVVHRDLKPGNLFMAKLADGSHFLKILDFGLAKRVNPLSPNDTIGRSAGTPRYMAPEQITGQGTSPVTDLYAVGCIAYELLTGETPFSAPNVVELFRLHQSAAPAPLPSSVLPLLSELVLSLLEKDPSKRPASAVVARHTLERVERRLLASSGTNVAHPVQKEDDEPSQVSGRVRARQPSTRRSGRSFKDEAPPAPTPPDTRPIAAVRRTAPQLEEQPARPTRLDHEEDDEELSLGASRFRGRDEVAEGSDAPTTHDLPPLQKRDDANTSHDLKPLATEPSTSKAGVAAVIVLVVLASVGLAWKLTRPEQVVIAEPPPAEQVEPFDLETRALAIEQRCLVELTEERQRSALDELKRLRNELINATPEEAQRQLTDFGTRWLTAPK